jgi:hypothetical protein
MPIFYIDSGSFNNLQVTGSLLVPGEIFGTASWATNALTASYVNPLTQNVTITGSLVVSGSNATLEIYGSKLIVGTGSGDEGGEILLGKPQTNTTLTGSGITIDAYQNKIRFFEQGGTARGAYIDITACAGGAGTNLLSGGGGATFNGGTNVDNRLITATGTSPELNGEANLTFNGSTLNVTGSLRTSGSIEATVGLGVENYKSPNRWALLSTTGCPSVTGQSLTSGSANSITTILVPFITNKTITVSSMSFESTTTPSPSTASVGIYAADQVTCRPTTLITSMSNIPIPSNRVYSGSLTTGPVTLSPGLYYTAFQHSGSATITFRSIPTANTMNIIGLTTPGNTTVPNYYAGVRAGGPASLPDSTSSFSTMNPLGGLNPPCIWMLIS